jgi:hypothetical protein
VMELESFHSSGNLDRSNVEMVWWWVSGGSDLW